MIKHKIEFVGPFRRMWVINGKNCLLTGGKRRMNGIA